MQTPSHSASSSSSSSSYSLSELWVPLSPVIEVVEPQYLLNPSRYEVIKRSQINRSQLQLLLSEWGISKLGFTHLIPDTLRQDLLGGTAIPITSFTLSQWRPSIDNSPYQISIYNYSLANLSFPSRISIAQNVPTQNYDIISGERDCGQSLSRVKGKLLWTQENLTSQDFTRNLLESVKLINEPEQLRILSAL